VSRIASTTEEAPLPTNGDRPKNPPRGGLGAGFGILKQHKAKSKGYADNFKVPEGKPVIVRFPDEGNFDAYNRHWLRGVTGRQTFSCLEDLCPLCDAGDVPALVALINVIDMSSGPEPEMKLWECTAGPMAKLIERDEDPRYHPVNKAGLYFAISKKKKDNGFFDFTVDAVKARDLMEDFGISPLPDEQTTDLLKDRYTSEVIKYDSREFLRDVVKGLGDE